MMKLLGLTGDIACGKSLVAKLCQERGAAHIDADRLVHELYADADFARRVIELFTPNFGGNVVQTVQTLLNKDGSVNREELGKIVFGDARSMRSLEALVHPAVAALRVLKLEMLRRAPVAPDVVVLEAVKLIESGQAEDCQQVWCVVCSPETQMQRLMEHRGLDEAQARARLAAGPDVQARRAHWGNLPLVMISNDGTKSQVEAQVEAAWQRLQSGRV